MSVLEGSMLQAITITEDMAKEQALVAEAELKGYRFIKVKLKKSYRANMPFIIGPMHILVGYVQNSARDGSSEVHIVEKQGKLWFRYDPLQRAHIGYMLDDKNKGVFSEIGYNRDFLASHWATGEFEILTKEVIDDIMVRIELMKAKRTAEEQNKASAASQQPDVFDVNVGDIDGQIEFLQNKKKAIEKARIEQTQKDKDNLKEAQDKVLHSNEVPPTKAAETTDTEKKTKGKKKKLVEVE